MFEPGTRVDVILDRYGCAYPPVSATPCPVSTPSEATPTHGPWARRPAPERATQRHRRASVWAHHCGQAGASCGNEGRHGDWECTHSPGFYSDTATGHSDESGSRYHGRGSGFKRRSGRGGAHTVVHGLPPSQRVRAARLWCSHRQHMVKQSTVNSQHQSTAVQRQQEASKRASEQASEQASTSSPTRPIRAEPEPAPGHHRSLR